MLTFLALQSYLVSRWHQKNSSLWWWNWNWAFFRWIKFVHYPKKLCFYFATQRRMAEGPQTTSNMSLEEKFKAAVKVIHSLPKDGPYQPSNGTKLKFYGLFKQATEGPCTVPKPGFWDLVGKYKWEAWNDLGHISKQEAMSQYVDNLKEIVETMSWDGNVEDFLNTIGPFYEFVNVNSPEMNHIKDTVDRLTSSSSSSSSSGACSAAPSPINSCPNSPLKSLKSSNSVESLETAQVHVENSTATYEHNHTPKPVIMTNGYHHQENSHPHPPPAPQHTYSRKNSVVSPQEIITEGNEVQGEEEDEIIGVTISTLNTVAQRQEDLERDEVPHHQEQSLKTRPSIEATSGTESEKYYSGDSEPDYFEDKAKTSQFYDNSSTSTINHCSSFPSSASTSKAIVANISSRPRKSSPNSKSNGAPINCDLILSSTVDRLNRDVDHILARLRILETAYAASVNATSDGTVARRRRRFFGGLSPSGIAFILMWPFAVHFLLKMLTWWWARRRRIMMASRLQ